MENFINKTIEIGVYALYWLRGNKDRLYVLLLAYDLITYILRRDVNIKKAFKVKDGKDESYVDDISVNA